MKSTAFASLLCLVIPVTFAMPGRVASISKYQGKVGLKHRDGEQELVKRLRTPLFQSDTIYTAPESQATVVYSDGTRIDLASNSKILIETNGRQREIALQQGSFKSDVKKYPGQRTTFKTPSGVAAVKGTLVDCDLLAEGGIRLAADLGMLTHQIPSMRFAMDLSQNRCAMVKFDKTENRSDVLSVRGELVIEVADVIARVEQGEGVSLKYDDHSGIVSVNDIIMNAQANKPDASFLLDAGDGMEFLETGTGYTATITKGAVTVRTSQGVRAVLEKGETLFQSRTWLEPETPEGTEVMLRD
ncbi:MAG: FecR family protein [Planctomycetota bacterium]|nr:FecR family protein [Planctomycetota bacterium]MDA1137736.1 FecR family protein [Planctomycetota bacterium]